MTKKPEPMLGLHVTGMNLVLPGDANEIPVQVSISQFDIGDQSNFAVVAAKTKKVFSGIIDTGATSTCISQNVANSLKLVPIGKRTVGTANGMAEHSAHMINLVLSNNIVFPALEVTSGDIGDTDFLLGMDILGQCSLSIQRLYGFLVVELKIFTPMFKPPASFPLRDENEPPSSIV